MDEATFKREVAFIRRAYAQRGGDLPKFVASSYDQIANEAKQRAFLNELIAESEKRKDYWDAVNLIARRQLGKGKALPTLLANWITDVLGDQFASRRGCGPDQRRGGAPWYAIRTCVWQWRI